MLPPHLQAKTFESLMKANIVCPPSYIEPQVLPVGGQLILASQAKTGKSFIMLELGRAMASASSPFDHPDLICPRACKVLLIEQELGEYGLKNRVEKIFTREEFKRLGFMADNFMYISKQPDIRLDSQQGLDYLYQIVADNDPQVLMLDPLGRFHNIDENDNQAVSKLWTNIDYLQREYPTLSIITSMHMSKPPDTRAGFDLLDPYRIRGASKHFDNVDGVITTVRTHNLSTPHQSWSANCRFTLRHGESPEDCILHFNEKNNGRVIYYKAHGEPLPQLVKKAKPEPKAVQLGL